VLHELVEGAREHLRGDGLTPRAAEVATGRGRRSSITWPAPVWTVAR
jgi:hypothetical protein